MAFFINLERDNNELKKIYNKKRKTHEELKIKKKEYNKETYPNWEILKEYKNGYFLLGKEKDHYDSFEDRVWNLFYRMGFTTLNKNNKFKISYDDENRELTKQIDVFAVDDETIIICECKSTNDFKSSNFKIELESYKGIIEGLRKTINKELPDKKISFIWATNNYSLGDKDLQRLKSFNFVHFTEKTIEYFENLADHLGEASKFQLLGYLFPNQKIKNLSTKVPAIQGKMGGHEYYSFMIKPADLLKFSYVLHRNNANNEMMPTYQRLIKKTRLKQIRSFIDNKGFFPNSIIINIDEKPRFDLAAQKQSSFSDAKIGILYLPEKYRSAYIIDGQHRLYGYSESEYADKHTIPVIAFIDLGKEEQVKMFMDINENQKAVPKLLRNTLIKDLYLESDDLTEVGIAQSLVVAENLGSNRRSPLYSRVLMGEDQTTAFTSITLENLRIAIHNRSGFLAKYKKNKMITEGSLDNGDKYETIQNLSNFLQDSFKQIKDFNEEEWEKDSKDGFLATNNVIMAIIYLLNDFINLNKLNIKEYKLATINKQIEPFILALCDVFSELTQEKKSQLKGFYGAGGPNKIYHELGYELNQKNSNYLPDWLEDYINDNKQNNVNESIIILDSIKKELVNILKTEINSNNLIEIVDGNLFLEITGLIAKTELEYRDKNSSFDGEFWELLNFNHINSIINSKSYWRDLFKPIFKEMETPEGKSLREFSLKYLELENKAKKKISLSLKEFTYIESSYEYIKKIMVDG